MEHSVVPSTTKYHALHIMQSMNLPGNHLPGNSVLPSRSARLLAIAWANRPAILDLPCRTARITVNCPATMISICWLPVSQYTTTHTFYLVIGPTNSTAPQVRPLPPHPTRAPCTPCPAHPSGQPARPQRPVPPRTLSHRLTGCLTSLPARTHPPRGQPRAPCPAHYYACAPCTPAASPLLPSAQFTSFHRAR